MDENSHVRFPVLLLVHQNTAFTTRHITNMEDLLHAIEKRLGPFEDLSTGKTVQYVFLGAAVLAVFKVRISFGATCLATYF